MTAATCRPCALWDHDCNGDPSAVSARASDSLDSVDWPRKESPYLSAFDGSVPKGSNVPETLANISSWLKEHGLKMDVMKQIRFVGNAAFVPTVGGRTVELELE